MPKISMQLRRPSTVYIRCWTPRHSKRRATAMIRARTGAGDLVDVYARMASDSSVICSNKL